ncbi:hypothetical protein BDW02DRAFT_570408 [Decorospora gaudefroyi]|uniref:Uncharacterized protein n=1 Tax=Decorospora gaudefroyi TaxID=184978 RepID=A0A6A5K9Y7_9PLEO|nr:hypothetical protein BDW02DRAFT_570408 [Decorospora gaudefroyi]
MVFSYWIGQGLHVSFKTSSRSAAKKKKKTLTDSPFPLSPELAPTHKHVHAHFPNLGTPEKSKPSNPACPSSKIHPQSRPLPTVERTYLPKPKKKQHPPVVPHKI